MHPTRRITTRVHYNSTSVAVLETDFKLLFSCIQTWYLFTMIHRCESKNTRPNSMRFLLLLDFLSSKYVYCIVTRLLRLHLCHSILQTLAHLFLVVSTSDFEIRMVRARTYRHWRLILCFFFIWYNPELLLSCQPLSRISSGSKFSRQPVRYAELEVSGD